MSYFNPNIATDAQQNYTSNAVSNETNTNDLNKTTLTTRQKITEIHVTAEQQSLFNNSLSEYDLDAIGTSSPQDIVATHHFSERNIRLEHSGYGHSADDPTDGDKFARYKTYLNLSDTNIDSPVQHPIIDAECDSPANIFFDDSDTSQEEFNKNEYLMRNHTEQNVKQEDGIKARRTSPTPFMDIHKSTECSEPSVNMEIEVEEINSIVARQLQSLGTKRQHHFILKRPIENKKEQAINNAVKALEAGNLQPLYVLSANGILNINQQGHKNRTFLMVAASRGHKDNVSVLMGLGGDIHLKDIDGNTALMYAAIFNQPECIELIIQDNLTCLNLNNKQGLTALMFACINGHAECVKILLNVGAEIGLRSKNEKTALMHAASNNNIECVAYILYYIEETQTDDTNILEEYINLRDSNNHTAVHMAALAGNTQCVLKLLEYEAKFLDLLQVLQTIYRHCCKKVSAPVKVKNNINGGIKTETVQKEISCLRSKDLSSFINILLLAKLNLKKDSDAVIASCEMLLQKNLYSAKTQQNQHFSFYYGFIEFIYNLYQKECDEEDKIALIKNILMTIPNITPLMLVEKNGLLECMSYSAEFVKQLQNSILNIEQAEALSLFNAENKLGSNNSIEEITSFLFSKDIFEAKKEDLPNEKVDELFQAIDENDIETIEYLKGYYIINLDVKYHEGIDVITQALLAGNIPCLIALLCPIPFEESHEELKEFAVFRLAQLSTHYKNLNSELNPYKIALKVLLKT